jgi:hypothetical protein
MLELARSPDALGGGFYKDSSTPFLRQKFAAAALFAVLSPLLSLGAEDAVSNSPPTEIRREMLLEYKFTAPGDKAAEAPSSLHSEATVRPLTGFPPGKDIVQMAQYEVREGGMPTPSLLPTAPIRAAGAPATVAGKLGIGVHYLQLGKVRLFVNTVLYVPFLIGFDW